jgi:CubicO group peptidase (beta-lactamase class C family)
MTHTGGIGEMPNVGDFADPDFMLWMSEDEFPGVPEAYPEGITIEVPPGTKWAYANHGWIMLGEIIARAEGAAIEEVVRRRVFEPLGMSDTDLLDQEHPELGTGYHREPGEDERELLQRIGREIPDEEAVDGHNIRGKYQYVRGRTAGGAQSTIPDMGRYASALLRQSKGIVSADTFEKMVSPQWCPDARRESWGLGFALRPFFGRRAFGHGGAIIGGSSTYLTVFPNEDLGVMIHMNLGYDEFDRKVVPAVVQSVLGAEEVKLAEHEIDATILESAPGVYEAPTPGPLTNFRIMNECGRVMITERDGRLTLRSRRGPWKQGVRMHLLDPSEPDLFGLASDATEPPKVALVRDEEGLVTGLRLARLAEMQRNEEIESW